ncbi:MAG: flagellar export chaperone FlgN [Selenomonadaceae bacterium]|nr:flagellar export chaperone FlgN [Selenomonadaceae bacterium]
MKRTIELLRVQLLLLGRLEDSSKALEEALKKNKGDEAGRLALEIEKTLLSLGKAEKSSDQYIKERNRNNWEEVLADFLPSPEKKMARDLLLRINERLEALKRATDKNAVLLDKDVRYVNFSINVLTGASAGTTYAATAAQPGAGRAIDMLDASV